MGSESCVVVEAEFRDGAELVVDSGGCADDEEPERAGAETVALGVGRVCAIAAAP